MTTVTIVMTNFVEHVQTHVGLKW